MTLSPASSADELENASATISAASYSEHCILAIASEDPRSCVADMHYLREFLIFTSSYAQERVQYPTDRHTSFVRDPAQTSQRNNTHCIRTRRTTRSRPVRILRVLQCNPLASFLYTAEHCSVPLGCTRSSRKLCKHSAIIIPQHSPKCTTYTHMLERTVRAKYITSSYSCLKIATTSCNSSCVHKCVEAASWCGIDPTTSPN